MLNLLVVCNKLVSSIWLMLSYGFWHFHHPNLLASSVMCIAFCSHWELCILRQYIQTSGRTFSCSPTHKPIHFLKTATIPTYHSISIAVPRYIAMQLPFYITWLVVIHHIYIGLHDSIQRCVVYPCYARSLHILLHCQRHTVLYIMLCSLWVIHTKKVCYHIRVLPLQWGREKWKEPWRPSKRETEKKIEKEKEKKRKKEIKRGGQHYYPLSTLVLMFQHLQYS